MRPEVREQTDPLAAGLRAILGETLIGVYLHGSAALGCIGPRSDLDVLAALRRPSTANHKRRLAELCLSFSQPYGRPRPPWPVELDVVVAPALWPWRHPAPFDFHYGESHREAFERGELEPWEHSHNPDLAAHLSIARAAGIVLEGPPIAETLPPVPDADYRNAVLGEVEWCRENAESRPDYAVLTLARVWATLAEGDIQSKVSAAEWARPRLPDELRPVLEHALALYRGELEEESCDDLSLPAYVSYVTGMIFCTAEPR